MTASVIKSNVVQLDLFRLNRLQTPLKAKRLVYVLLVHRAEEEVRYEISLPSQLDDDDRVIKWAERIIMPAEPLDPPTVLSVPDDLPDIDVEVTRKSV